MNLKQASLFGILFWLIIFVEISIIGFSPDLSVMGDHGFQFNQTGNIVHLIATALIAGLLARLYYKQEKPAFIDALQVAVVMVIVGLLLDVVITVPLFVKSYGAHFGDPNLWIGVTLSVLAFALAASYTSYGQKKKK